MSARSRRVVVIGAGIAGLLAARALRAAGLDVVVLDKGRGVGGRMATRRMGASVIDHGAQFFTARDPTFRSLVQDWIRARAVAEWARSFPTDGGPSARTPRPCYRGVGGMVDVAKHLARDLDVRTGRRVLRVMLRGERLVVGTDRGEDVHADAVLLTAPVPQSLNVVDGGGLALPRAVRDRLEAVAYEPCFAVLARLDGESRIPEPGGLRLDGDPVSWVADNARKGVSHAETAVTIHAGPAWSREHLDVEREDVGRILLGAVTERLGAAVREHQVHLWRYALAASEPPELPELSEPFLGIDGPAPIAFAGDAFGGPRVEGAARSGLAAGEWLASRLT